MVKRKLQVLESRIEMETKRKLKRIRQKIQEIDEKIEECRNETKSWVNIPIEGETQSKNTNGNEKNDAE